MRKELTVFVKTTDISGEEEVSLTTTQNGSVVFTLPNGHKVGINPDELSDALFELNLFKRLETMKNTNTATKEKLEFEVV